MRDYTSTLCCLHLFRKKRHVIIALLGLDNAGKTTLANTLRGDKEILTTPTYGFASHSLVIGCLAVNLFDLGGGRNIRRIWKTYLPEVHGIIFVVDAADAQRLPEAAAVLADTLAEPPLQGKPLLVLANKQDLPGAALPAAVEQALGLSGPCQRMGASIILPCVAKSHQDSILRGSARQGLAWLLAAVDSMYAELGPRVEREAAASRGAEEARKEQRAARVQCAREEREREGSCNRPDVAECCIPGQAGVGLSSSGAEALPEPRSRGCCASRSAGSRLHWAQWLCPGSRAATLEACKVPTRPSCREHAAQPLRLPCEGTLDIVQSLQQPPMLDVVEHRQQDERLGCSIVGPATGFCSACTASCGALPASPAEAAAGGKASVEPPMAGTNSVGPPPRQASQHNLPLAGMLALQRLGNNRVVPINK